MAENYKVQQGDCVSSIAFEKGFFVDTIWNHSDNKELKESRKDPNVLMPGDIVHIPDKRLRELSKPTNEVHKFRVKNTPKPLRLQLKYLETPLRDIDYKLNIDGIEKTGKTDSEGWLMEWIFPDAKLARIVLQGGVEFDLKLGYQDPVDEISGLQKRLSALGYYTEKTSGEFDENTRNSVRAFQFAQDIEVTGEADERTKQLLKKLVGN